MADKRVFLLVYFLVMVHIFTSLTLDGNDSAKTAGDNKLVEQQVRVQAASRDGEGSTERGAAVEVGDGTEGEPRGAQAAVGDEVMTELEAELNPEAVSQQQTASSQVPIALTPEKMAVMVMVEARAAIKDLYEESAVLQDSQGNLALRHPRLTNRQQVSEYFSKYFGQPVLGLMNLFMIRNTPDSSYTLVKYKGMTDILTADVESTNVTKATNSTVVVVAQLTDGGEHWSKLKVRYTISKDSKGSWKITGVNILSNNS